MNLSPLKGLAAALMLVTLATGCATRQPYDYTAFKQSNPKSVLILPPLNNTPEVKATYSMLAQMSAPLAESGYYVFPVAVVDETFKQNGLATASDIHNVAPAKLREIFGADAALYVDIKSYGVTYTVIASDVTVTAEARLVDLKTGQLLWDGKASASSSEQRSSGSGGLAGILISAIVNQITNTLSDRSHQYAGITSQRLLTARPNGVLYGPRSPMYGKDGVQQ